ncbi:GGDEF domain-containing protein, partial [Klebsiella pneumoniae]|nr:GGDEF domain-containing protein [Klebsiella pneumoniae]
RENRHFSRRVPEERIEEFHLFAQDFNSLLGEMEDCPKTKAAVTLRSSKATVRSSTSVLLT